MDPITPEAVLTVGGAAIVLTIVMQAVLGALGWTGATRDRFAPLLAIVGGIILVGGFAIYQGADLGAAILTGILAGAASMGVHDTASGLGAPI